MHPYVHSSTIHNSQDMETTLWWMDKEDVVHDFTGGPMVENLPASAGDTGSIPDSQRSHIPQSKSVCHNYWACTLEPGSCDYWSYVLQLLKPMLPRAHALQQEKPPQWEAHAP